jgi:hypothetical protein
VTSFLLLENADDVLLEGGVDKLVAEDHVAGGTNVNLTPATETDAAQALSFVKPIRKTLTAATSTEAAQVLSVTKPIRKTVTSVTETDAAQVLSVTKPIRKTLTAAAETDAAQALDKDKSDTLTAATEADAAQALSVTKTIFKALTAATESDAAQVLSITGGGFSPDQIAGLEMWLKADAISASDGDPVATWEDSHTSNKDATQGTGGSQPTYQTNEVNGLPIVRFDGTDDVLNVAGILNNDATRTVFVLAKIRAYQNGDAVMGWQAAAFIGMTATGWQYRTNEAAGGVVIGTAAAGTTHIAAVRFNSTSSADGYFDDGAATNFDPSGGYQNGVAALQIGARGSTAFGAVDVGEALVYDSALSDTDLDNVRGYLNDKWFGGAPQQVTLTPATSTESAQALSFVKPIRKTLTPATETDAAQGLSATKTIRKALTPALEIDAAQALDKDKRVVVLWASETDTAQVLSITHDIVRSLTPATELDQALALSIAGFESPETHPALGGDVVEQIRGGVFDETATGGEITVHTRGGVVVERVRGGDVIEPTRSATTAVSRGGIFDETATGGAVTAPIRGGAVVTPTRGGSLALPGGGVVVERTRGGAVTELTRGGAITEPRRGGIHDETSTGGSIP